MLKVAFGKQTLRRMQVFEWFSKFRSGVTLQLLKHPGCPLTRRTDENVDLVTCPQKQKNRRLWVADIWGITLGQFGAFWKKMWTGIRLLLNLCLPAEWAAEGELCHDMTFRRGFKDRQTCHVTCFFSQLPMALTYHHYSSRIVGCTCQDSNSALHRLLLMVLLSLGPLYRVPRRLLLE